eukprot:CAMPEP_0170514482 /NCGR_PEP_ID=MMETSP0209-20121228/1061_1 /TAXON_ID=665100 ORGANISM="Litonotus pictus, Strain P1" /NCGR_SAMPLE_ID=MMETSP0209 /ASSEMBLY_ACC=CAM_ASM_000301 /LENGTH=284 /DNA_ID=CAMNT_0010798589 /DNA_START=217 /DNA_END=1071 /DNA_ORIENTATION=+
MTGKLKGLQMELQDGAFPLVKGIVHSVKPEEAFADVDYAVFCGSLPRGKGMERKDLLSKNGKIFKEQGKYIDQYASKDVKVLVVGNPANTNCLVLMKNAPSINPKNFSALTRLDHNRLLGQVGEKLGIPDVEQFKNFTIWGNHSKTQYPHIDYGTYEKNDVSYPVTGLLNDKEYIEGDLIKNVAERGAKIIEQRQLSSAASAASASCDHVRDWFLGTKDSWVSMAVISNGEYGAPKDVIFSFPCVCKNGQWTIVEGLKISDFSKKKIEETGNELKQEKEMALSE